MIEEKTVKLIQYLEDHTADISPVVDFNKLSDSLFALDFTSANTFLDAETIADTALFSAWIEARLAENSCRYGIGGYNEHRTIYSRSALFNTNEEPRTLHLGTDIWGPEGTPVYAPLQGQIHSFKFNNNFGDYGATLILEHEAEGLKFYTIYGHLNLESIRALEKGQKIIQGQKIAEFGSSVENGQWPTHLHFQLIFDLGGMMGDYPGVCRFSERAEYLSNCPDPVLLLNRTFQ